MATDEDARTAARRIVEQVLSSGAPTTGPSGRIALADDVVDDVVIELTDEFDVEDPIAVIEDVAEDLAEDADVAADDVAVVDASEPRARAKALVAEVLAAHAPPVASGGTPASPTAARPGGPPVDSTSRSRARELVAAAIAAAEEREAAARAEAEARAAQERAEAEARAARERAAAEAAERAEAEAAARREREREAAQRREEARRAEQERAEAERERLEAIERERRAEQERLARERERAAAEERERALWADADRDVAAHTTPVDVPPREDRTVPMSVAELAANGQPDEVTDERVVDPGRPSGATSTLALPREETGTEVAEPRILDEPRVPEVEPRVPEDEPGVPEDDPSVLEEDPRVLEAVVELDTPLPPARGGRWLLVSVIGAITLAVVFPLAVRALLELVALS